MKFVVSSSDFLGHLSLVSKVIASKNTLPILDCLLLELSVNKLSIKASDADTVLVSTMSVADWEGDGRIAIPAKLLIDPIKELGEQPVTVEVDEETLQVSIQFQNGRFSLIGQSADAYPEMPKVDEANALLLEVVDLASGINHSLFATAAQDEIRPVMGGVFFDITPTSINFVATDSHKLVRIINTKYAGMSSKSFILPKKPLGVIKSILPKEKGNVKVSVGEKNAKFEFENVVFICRLIEGRYPNYNAVIPTNNPNKVVADKALLLSALKRMAIFASQEIQLVRLELSENQILLSAKDADFSTAAEERFACQYAGAPMVIGFKANYFIDILNNMDSEEVTLSLSDPSRSGLVIPSTNRESEEYIALLMPINVNE